MNEDLLKSFRKTPDLPLLGRIRARLEKRERRQLLERYSFMSLLTLFLALGMLMTFSSRVRADVITIIKRVGGLQFEVTGVQPWDPDEPYVETEPDEVLSWEQARSRFVSPLQLPAYVPEGYEREADTYLYLSPDGKHGLDVFWSKEGQFPRIGLSIVQVRAGDQDFGMILGEDTLEEITLDGKPAVIFRGSWNVETQEYDPSVMVSLLWRYDENTFYWLWVFDQAMAGELINMAESVP